MFDLEKYNFIHEGCQYKFFQEPNDTHNHILVYIIKGNKGMVIDLGLMFKDRIRETIGFGTCYVVYEKENDYLLKMFTELVITGELELLWKTKLYC